MGTGYVRRSTTEIATGEVIEATDFTNEFNDIVSALQLQRVTLTMVLLQRVAM